MKTYDYKRAKEIIKENMADLESASLGMHEDWFWTAETVWEGGAFKRDLPDDAQEMNDQFIEARKNGLSMFLDDRDPTGFHKSNPEYEKYSAHTICGIYGSDWATPALQLCFKDGSEKMIEVSAGENTGTMRDPSLGVLSGPVQDNITPLTKQ